MRTEALSNQRRRGENRAIRRTDKGKGAGFHGPAKAFVCDVPAYHHLGIWNPGLCRYRHGSARRSEDAGCLDSAMVSAATPRSRYQRLQSPQARALRPPAVGWGAGHPGRPVASLVARGLESRHRAPRSSCLAGTTLNTGAHAGHGPWTEAPGVWGLQHILGTSCSERTCVSWTVPATDHRVTWPQ